MKNGTKKSLDININLTSVLLFICSAIYYYDYAFADGGDIAHILGAIFLIGSVLYNPKDEKILKTFSFKSGDK